MIDSVILENKRRNALLATPYDPVTGVGAGGERREMLSPDGTLEHVPVTMVDDPQFAVVRASSLAWKRLRIRHDFEYWAATCVTIRDKLTGRDVRLRLNRPQRRVLSIMEGMRLAAQPIRLIMLKARQWGGSTLILMYMAWIQCCLRRNWHSLICAHVKDTSAAIRAMYGKMLDNYPPELWEEETAPEFRPFERSINTRVLPGRDCRVTLASSERQDAVRGFDFVMAHLSEVAFWCDSAMRSPEAFIRAVSGGVARVDCSLIVLESTANGVGHYFHAEWMRSKRGDSDKTAVFVPWHEIDIYSSSVTDAAALWDGMDARERALWEKGCTLEQIQWYHDKRREYATPAQMAAEFPSDDLEAFASTSRSVFSPAGVEALREGCCDPVAVGELVTSAPVGYGALVVKEFCHDTLGRLKVWKWPQSGGRCYSRYVTAVDIGGRSDRSDYSVISVIDTITPDGRPEVVAQWRGHIDHDLLTWKAAAIAQWYDEALLVIESNTLETEDADNSLFTLSELNHVYRNLYYRVARDRVTLAPEPRVGFHTNRATKTMVITRLIGLVRDRGYIERDLDACDELDMYECDAAGRYGAKPGYHDDILMTRAIALHVALSPS